MTASPVSAILLLADNAVTMRHVKALVDGLGKVITATRATQALTLARSGDVDVAVLCFAAASPSNLALITDLRSVQPDMEIICVSACQNLREAVQATQLGAFEYIVSPQEIDTLPAVVERALAQVAQKKDDRHSIEDDADHSLVVGDSPRMRQLHYLVQKVAPTDVPVLLQGPSGAGKEVLANAIQRQSTRRNAPFIIKNCATLSKELSRSELFGHMRGSFTGATHDRRGLFAEANHGTLFLDEIGELPLDVQPYLLRVLENGVYRPVGSMETRSCDVRLIFATNRNLAAAVDAGTFNEALYHRIHVFTLQLPSLAEHIEDIPHLLEHFLRVLPLAAGRTWKVDPRIYECLKSYSWPGNVRELRNVIERIIILADNDIISGKGLPPEIGCSSEACRAVFQVPAGYGEELPLMDMPPLGVSTPSGTCAATPSAPATTCGENAPHATLSIGLSAGLSSGISDGISAGEADDERLEVMEKHHILRILHLCNDNRSLAAKRLGIGRRTLYRKLEQWGMA